VRTSDQITGEEKMLFRRRGLGFGRRGFNFHFGRRSSSGFGMYNRRGGRKTGIIIGVILAVLIILLVLVFSIRIREFISVSFLLIL